MCNCLDSVILAMDEKYLAFNSTFVRNMEIREVYDRGSQTMKLVYCRMTCAWSS